MDHHFSHLLLHGVLHIAGYDHEERDEEMRMQALETHLLGKLGIPSPYTTA
ncbi:MAG: rRNA maturation RNase YbeY [Aaplasma endosymbiont of Hyalomma asiaticum]